MTLIQLFMAIANAIRAKKGTSETIKAEDFPTEINSIPSGGGYPPDWSEIGYEDTPQGVIDGFNYAKEIYDGWDDNVTNVSNMFKNDKTLILMPKVNTSNVLYMNSTFNNCTFLTTIPLLDTSNVVNMNDMFYNCTSLKNIPLLDTSKVTNMANMFRNCTSLTNESLNNILAMCIGATSYTGTSTLKYIGLTQEQATICQGLSNYQAFLDAGWTTGY